MLSALVQLWSTQSSILNLSVLQMFCYKHLEEGRRPHLHLHQKAAVKCLIFIIKLQHSFCPSIPLLSAVKLQLIAGLLQFIAGLLEFQCYFGYI